jgi:uncharacterized membrane protein
MNTIIDFISRLHPLVVHLPIGILVLAGALEIWRRYTRPSPDWQPLIHTALLAGAICTLPAVCSGWLLATHQGYEAVLLDKHRWLGVATAISAWAVWYFRHWRWYPGLLSGTLVLLTFAGHYGGALTHGENYLTEPFGTEREAVTASVPAFTPETPVFAGIILPILQEKCVSCHKTGKTKGGLNLESEEMIVKGGKNGPVVLPQTPSESPLLHRIHLPMHDDEHMPPRGKTQLSDTEIKLLGWWLEQGADFRKKVREIPATPEIQAILAGSPPQNPAFARTIDPADASVIRQLTEANIKISRLSEQSALLSVSCSGNQALQAQHFEGLKKIRNQIGWLDLAYSNVTDPWLANIGPMPQLMRLNLAHTTVSAQGIQHLAASDCLEFLNLVDTRVSDAAAPVIQQIKALKSLFSWKSQLSEQGLSQIKQNLPSLVLHQGPAADSSAAPLQLRPPKLLFGRTIFDDTMQVKIDFPFKGVQLFYTLDEASPTTRSIPYQHQPIVLHESTRVRAIAAREGWANSEVVEAMFAKRRYKPVKATLSNAPSPKYSGAGAAAFIDGLMGEVYTDKAFLGFEGEHAEVVIDFEKPVELHRVNLHCIENNNAWIFLPRGVQIWTSTDGKTPGPPFGISHKYGNETGKNTSSVQCI